MKRRPSKLDAVEADLVAWFAEGATLAQAADRLRQEKGLTVSVGRLSGWWSDRQEEQAREKLLARIATGAVLDQRIDAEFQRNPAPQLRTIVDLLKVLIMHATVEGQADPALLEMVPGLLKQVLDFVRTEQKEREIGLDVARFQRETCDMFIRGAADQRAAQIAASADSNHEKIQRLGQLMFGETWVKTHGDA